jgi:glycosyltransferase involved in cell wall biosynthesis
VKILFVVYEAFIGGHVLSASTIARHMRARGHETVFAGKTGAMAEIVGKEMPFENIDIPVFHGDRPTLFTWASFPAISQLRSIIRKHHIELVHAFDARAYFHCYPAALFEHVGVVCTLCGGTDPTYNLPRARKLMVFSEEQKAKMTDRFGWPSKNVDVIRTRLDLDRILSSEMTLHEDLQIQARLLAGVPRIMMISSFDDTKIRAVMNVLDAVASLLEAGRRLQLVLIGGEGDLHQKAAERAQEFNRRFGADTIVLTGPMRDAFRLLQGADIVLGVGRSAFEGMAFGKPTIIVGQNGFAGVMAPGKISDLAYYNFSGRNAPTEVPPSILAAEVSRLLDDSAYAAAAGSLGRDFVTREIDVRHGLERIEAVYRDIEASSGVWPRAFMAASFLSSLFPVVLDNAAHRPKIFLKKFLNFCIANLLLFSAFI